MSIEGNLFRYLDFPPPRFSFWKFFGKFKAVKLLVIEYIHGFIGVKTAYIVELWPSC
jgi:hypothetical protein